jgi:hypothetical protein
MIYVASAVTGAAVLVVLALVLRYRFASYGSLVYVDREAVACLAEDRRASARVTG